MPARVAESKNCLKIKHDEFRITDTKNLFSFFSPKLDDEKRDQDDNGSILLTLNHCMIQR